MNVQKVGIGWFREGEYDDLRKMFIDGELLPDNFEEWLRKAEDGVADLRRQGYAVVKAYIHLQTFTEWCRSRSLNIDAAARKRFAAEFAARDDSQ